ncbi:hypothetical protein K9M48_02870 [Candidatus Gracilibacteria bacterium]|nr:hypothetical protein [Candidatus Gracilibacteria bacterium]
MIRAVLGNLLGSLSTVLRKKTLLISRLPKIFFRFLGEVNGIIIAFVIILIAGFNRRILTDRKIIVGIVIILIVAIRYDYIQQSLYKKEKISSLLPYENLNSVFTIIVGFFIFKDSSLISVGISMLVILITIGSSINIKKFERPKNLKSILLVQVLVTIECILTGYFLKDMGDQDYFILYELIIVAILIVPVLIKGYISKIKGTKIKFRGYETGQATLTNISFLLYLFLVSEFGVVISTLLSFLANGVTMLFGYIILKEKPGKKDIILTIITTLLVGIGFYFK